MDDIESKSNDGNISAIAALIILNALIITKRLALVFYEESNILAKISSSREPYNICKNVWQNILKKDYKPIFYPALSILNVIKKREDYTIINELAEVANDISDDISDFSYDHSGPLFCKILGDNGVSDGAFYTDNLAAYMIADISLPDKNCDDLKVIDPTCGSGTLLLAFLENMKKRISKQYPDREKEFIHKNLVEKSIYGLDINYHATQFTAINLTLGYDGIYNRMNVATLKDGIKNGIVYAGSLGLLNQISYKNNSEFLFDDLEKKTSNMDDILSIAGSDIEVKLGTFDIVIMNPPFTLIENLVKKFPQEERLPFRENLEDIRKRLIKDDKHASGVCGKGNAFGPYFILLAKKLLKEIGTLCMVRPISALTGVSSIPERCYLAKYFHIDTIMTSHERGNVNFSVGCGINESLLVLRKINDIEQEKRDTRHIVFHKRPKTLKKTKEFLHALEHNNDNIINKYAKIISLNRKIIERGDWSFACWYDPSIRNKVIEIRNNINLTKMKNVCSFVNRQDVAKLLSVKDVGKEIFDIILYSRKEIKRKTMETIVDMPAKLEEKVKSYKLNNKRGSLFIMSKMNIESNYLVALKTEKDTFSISHLTCLPFSCETDYKNALCLFLNSTVGWVQILNCRAKTLGYFYNEKSVLEQIFVPPPESPHIGMLSDIYEKYKNVEVQQNRNAHKCPVRKVFDDAVAKVLDVSTESIDHIRNMIANEPLINQKKNL